MNENLRKFYELSGLEGISFSDRIEHEINNLPYVKSVVINYLTSRAIVELNNVTDNNKVFNDIHIIVKNIDDSIDLKEIGKSDSLNNDLLQLNEENKKHSSNLQEDYYEGVLEGYNFHKTRSILIGIGLLFFITALLIKDNWNDYIWILAYLIIGAEVIFTTLKNIFKSHWLDESLIICLATIVALIIGKYADAIGVMVFYQVVKSFELTAVSKYKNSVSHWIDLKQEYVNVRGVNGEMVATYPDMVKINDVVVVKPGELVPLDGIITKGASRVDTSIVSGEPMVTRLKVRDEVLSGFINQTETIEIKVRKKFKESLIWKVLEQVQNTLKKESSTENFISRFYKHFTIIIILSSLIFGVYEILFAHEDLVQGLYRALVILVLCYNYSLKVSIHLCFFDSINTLYNNSILIKNKSYLEVLKTADVMVFDKTSTLTDGTYHVIKTVPKGFISEDMLLEYASYAEFYSNHPISKAILKAFKELSTTTIIDKSRIKSFEEIPGKGVKIYFGDRYVYAGNHKLMEEFNIPYENPKEIGTVVYIAINQNYAGYLVLADKVKDTAPRTIKILRDMGINKIAMVTGDNERISNYVGEVLNINEVYSELSMEDKLNKIKELQKENRSKNKLIFAGDPIVNDLDVEKAYLGIALNSSNSTLAFDDSHIAILTDDPSKIALSISIARKTERIASQNIILSIGMKTMMLTFAFLGLTPMWVVLLIEAVVTKVLVYNSLKIKGFKD